MLLFYSQEANKIQNSSGKELARFQKLIFFILIHLSPAIPEYGSFTQLPVADEKIKLRT